MASPQINGPSALDVAEDVKTALGSYTVSDAEDDSLFVTATVGHGTIRLSAQYDSIIDYSADGRTLAFIPSQKSTTVNAALATLVYTPDADYNGQDTFHIRAADAGNPVDVFTNIDVKAVNDLPKILAPLAIDASEDGVKALAGVSVSDVDDSALLVTLHVRYGTLAVDPQYASIAFVSPSRHSVSFNFQQTSDINAALATLTYRPGKEYSGPDDLFIVADDNSGVTSSVHVPIAVKPVNDAPEIVSNGGGANFAMALEEGQTLVTRIVAVDVEGDAIKYVISGGADAKRFEIDPKSGKLTFLDAPDFAKPKDADGDNRYEVTVKATDGKDADQQSLVIEVKKSTQPVAPKIVSDGGGDAAAVAVVENTSHVTQVLAQDDNGGKLKFSISGGADAGKFEIDALTGTLQFKSPADFDTPTDAGQDNVYDVIVKVSDGKLTDTQSLAITVTGAEEAPVITSNGGGNTAFLFHAEDVAAVTTVVATDPDAGDTIAYSIRGGADAALFAIDQNTGALRFVTAPDHAAPADADGDNVYQVTVGASDGQDFDFQALSIAVDDSAGVLIVGTPRHDKVNADHTVKGQPAPTKYGDFILGRHGPDKIAGLAGDDFIFGNVGSDKLKGGSGNDVISGGGGFDVLKGGGGADIFHFDTAPQEDKFARVKDFAPGEDTLAFEHKVYQYLPSGVLAEGMLRIGKTAKDDDDRIIYDPKSGKLKSDDDGVGGHKAIHIATLDKKLDIHADDILVV